MIQVIITRIRDLIDCLRFFSSFSRILIRILCKVIQEIIIRISDLIDCLRFF